MYYFSAGYTPVLTKKVSFMWPVHLFELSKNAWATAIRDLPAWVGVSTLTLPYNLHA